ncbi:MAG TPA: GNAT family N-acetyltransferase [Arthrobacter sp.]|nr:GNAT family N-acetyltransferase [Arthrobacter sp.]
MLGNPRKGWSIRVAECSGQIIGFAFFGPSFTPEGQETPRDHQLFSLYIAAEHYGTGAGQALLDATAGHAPAMLWVATDNPRAMAFYRRNGFEFDGTEQTDPRAPAIVDAPHGPLGRVLGLSDRVPASDTTAFWGAFSGQAPSIPAAG